MNQNPFSFCSLLHSIVSPSSRREMYLFMNIRCVCIWHAKGTTDEIQFIIDEDYEDETDVHESVDEAAEMADDPDKTNQSQYHLTYSKLNEKLREKLTPIFNRKHYSSLPPTSNLSYFEQRPQKNNYNFSAYISISVKNSKFLYLCFNFSCLARELRWAYDASNNRWAIKRLRVFSICAWLLMHRKLFDTWPFHPLVDVINFSHNLFVCLL